MKFINLETKNIIEVTDELRIKKLKGYPDKFEEIKEEVHKEEMKEEQKEKSSKKVK